MKLFLIMILHYLPGVVGISTVHMSCGFLSEYKGKFTVPVLWDKQMNTMVNNKSKDILRILNDSFQQFCDTDEQRQLDLYPSHLRDQIDEYTDYISPYVIHSCHSIIVFPHHQDAPFSVKTRYINRTLMQLLFKVKARRFQFFFYKIR